ncbi:cocaine- and amphetamine-regulated transcript protein-like [Rhinophrynus dorsalis]
MDKGRRFQSGSLLPLRFSAMLLALCLFALLKAGKGEDSGQEISQEDDVLPPKSLVVALKEMLEYNQDKGISLQKKASQVPRCDVGERCALKHGPRIGKLCDCLRGTSCNSFLLRCY